MNAPVANSRYRLRLALLWAHRYSGLAVLVFLVCAGITGAILTWNDELERLFAPQLFTMPRHSIDAKVLDPFDLRDRVAKQYPAAQINGLSLGLRSNKVADFQLEYPDPGSSSGQQPDDHVFVDPISGSVLGTRRDGDLRQGAKNIMPFIDSLHEELALGDVGRWILGIASLLWAIQCLSGLYLSLPISRREKALGARSWWARWRPSWRIRPYGDFKKIVFDVHRAGSLWLWGVLLMFAWSAMSFNLAPVYAPIVGLLGYGSQLDAISDAADPTRPPALNWREAYAAAVNALSKAAAVNRFSVLSQRLMMYRPDKRLYEYRVQTSRDVEARGNTRVFVDADTGRVMGIDMPTGGKLGNSLTTWIEALHEGAVFGVVYRMCVSVFGVCIAILSIAGGLVWVKRRRLVASA